MEENAERGKNPTLIEKHATKNAGDSMPNSRGFENSHSMYYGAQNINGIDNSIRDSSLFWTNGYIFHDHAFQGHETDGSTTFH